MITTADEGFTDGETGNVRGSVVVGPRRDMLMPSLREREELAYRLLASLPRSSLAVIQRKIVPLLQLDVVGLLPDEVALQVFSNLPSQSLLTCSLVSRRWCALANDQSLWKELCMSRNWEWKTPTRPYNLEFCANRSIFEDSDDEGMGDEEDSEDAVQGMLLDDSGFASMIIDPLPVTSAALASSSSTLTKPSSRLHIPMRHSAPPSVHPFSHIKPDYKLLHQTYIRLHNRMISGSYSLSNLQTRGAANAHTNTIYCLQLYTYPDTGIQVLFTGSKDHTIREWDLSTGAVTRVVEGIHDSSVLSLCVHNGLLASGGSDQKVVVWDLTRNRLVKVIQDHDDSVLCVRFDDQRLVSCSKDRTVRTYLFPDLSPRHILRDHRAAVNAVSISAAHIVSASGDRSMRVWDAETGVLLRTFENHHARGIASIDFKPPFVLSGSSDKHLRLLDISTSEGWSTSPDFDTAPSVSALAGGSICEACGGNMALGAAGKARRQHAHEDLVRSVALNAEFVVSGSYDFTVKVWDRKTGALVADLAGGHTGRIFCVGFDCAKIVSCGEDQRICIWDFSHGIDTSFIKL
ncbi:WD40 repeat-like protein [Amylocystis lapponica]|nr:WD40 repeat-like protein [Amylocystis lapponica]